MAITDTDLKQACEYWQKVLRLQDWTVKVRFVRQYDLHSSQQANCSSNCAKKCAQIRIVSPDDYSNPEWPQDVEKSLVHELLHLHTAPFTDVAPPPLPLMLEEQAIDSLAGAFVSLHRELPFITEDSCA